MKVQLIAHPAFAFPDCETWCDARDDQLNGTPAEDLIETAGRECYDSFGRGRSSEAFHEHLIESGHHNPAYHAFFSFRVSGISKAFSAELNRHHVGATPSQRSTRYVDESESAVITHPLVDAFLASAGHTGDGERVVAAIAKANESAREAYRLMVPILETALVARGVDKHQARKQARGAARNHLPLGIETSQIWTANVAACRTVIAARGVEGADGEAREFACQLLEAVRPHAPWWFKEFHIEVASDFGRKVTKR